MIAMLESAVIVKCRGKSFADIPNYRKATDAARSCGTCSFFRDGVCTMFDARVESDMVCDEWAAKSHLKCSQGVNAGKPGPCPKLGPPRPPKPRERKPKVEGKPAIGGKIAEGETADAAAKKKPEAPKSSTITLEDGRVFPVHNGEPLSWSLTSSSADEAAGSPKLRAVVRAMVSERPEQLQRELAQLRRDSSGHNIFAPNARRILGIIEDELKKIGTDNSAKEKPKEKKKPQPVPKGFTGERRDSAGRRICYRDGKRVPCPKKEGAEKPKLGGGKVAEKVGKAKVGSDKPGPMRENLSTEDLGMASSRALDAAYGYGVSKPGDNFGWTANQGSVNAFLTAAKKTRDVEKLSAAIHDGWGKVALSYDDPVYQQKPEKREARKKLAETPYAKLSEEEKQKDRVVALALLSEVRPPDYWGSKEQPYWRPGPNKTVDNVITRDGKNGREILMIRRKADSPTEGGKWALPGGFHDSDAKKGQPWKPGKETAAEAALRELKEETGLDADTLKANMRESGSYAKRGRDPRDNPEAWSESTAFQLHIPAGVDTSKIIGQDDADKAEWVPVSQIGKKQIAFDHADIIKDALNPSGAPSKGFTGERKDSRGRRRCYKDGKLVPCAGDKGEGEKPAIGGRIAEVAKPKRKKKPSPKKPAATKKSPAARRSPKNPKPKAKPKTKPGLGKVAEDGAKKPSAPKKPKQPGEATSQARFTQALKIISDAGHLAKVKDVDPFGYTKFNPAGHEAARAAAKKFVEKAVDANHFARPTIREVYNAIREADKSLSIEDAKGLLAVMHQDKEIRLGAFTQAYATIPPQDQPFITFLHRELNNYVGSRRFEESGTTKPKLVPAAGVAAAKKKPAAKTPPKNRKPKSAALVAKFKIPDKALYVRNFPDLRQTELFSCGAIALECVARYHSVGGDGTGEDGGASEAWFIQHLGTTAEDGTPPKRMVELAKKIGLKVVHEGTMTPEQLKKIVRGGTPCIVLVQAWVDDDAKKDGWDDGHYLCVLGFDKDHVYFEDPSLERTRGWMQWQDFLRRWHDVSADGTKYVHWGLALTKAEEPAEEIKDSAVRRKCMQGVNAGKPGPCPTGISVSASDTSGIAEHGNGTGHINDHLPSRTRPQLSEEQISEVQQYLDQDTPYYDVNEHLRSGGRLSDDAKKLQSAIDRAGVLAEPVTVYRGFRIEDEDGLNDIEEQLKSGQFTDRGFMSTSTTRGGAFEGNIQFTIMAQHGLDASHYGSNSREFLLPANSDFRVVSFKRNGNNITATLEQIISPGQLLSSSRLADKVGKSAPRILAKCMHGPNAIKGFGVGRLVRKCQQGVNAGKPGRCPLGQSESGTATAERPSRISVSSPRPSPSASRGGGREALRQWPSPPSCARRYSRRFQRQGCAR